MRDVGRTQEEFVNHEPQASDLRILIVPVNPWKNRASSELLYKSNRLQVSMVYRLINHTGCW